MPNFTITLTKPDEFIQVPWKNGLGYTTELAINEGGNLNNFDWRLSIASVITDGAFSNFSGYQRNLVLIEGNGLTLDHQNGAIDELTSLLDIARFDGGCKTLGSLSCGNIKDFNIITQKDTVSAKVQTYCEYQDVEINIARTSLCFAYSLSENMTVKTLSQACLNVPRGHLVKISVMNTELTDNQLTIKLTGKNIIVVLLDITQ